MAVAQSPVLTSGKGADLIRSKTGRSCTRQNLEKLCKQGRLPRSTVSTAPVRVRGDLLVEEYLGSIDPRQSVRDRPGIAETPGPMLPPPADGTLPDYTESKKKTEYEKGLLLELQRKTQEALLLPADQVEKAWANAVAISRTKLLALPTRVRQRVPHLSLEEVALIEELVRETLEDLSSGE